MMSLLQFYVLGVQSVQLSSALALAPILRSLKPKTSLDGTEVGKIVD